jgi:hypothetical protein
MSLGDVEDVSRVREAKMNMSDLWKVGTTAYQNTQTKQR